MSDFAYVYRYDLSHPHLITLLTGLMGCKKYLELGIWDGSTIESISRFCPYCVGVDIKDDRKYFNYQFKMMTTDMFFEENTETFDMIFIDADHNFESVKKDFINSIKILNKFGIIMIHDTDPMTEMYIQPGYCGDSYKMINWLEDNYKNFNVLSLPITQAGLTIINRKNETRVNEYKK